MKRRPRLLLTRVLTATPKATPPTEPELSIERDEPASPTDGDGGLVRLRIDLAYDGTAYAGWARQPGQRTVQGVLEDALAVIMRPPSPPQLTVAGRTDAGVHARGQVAHLDVVAAPPDTIVRRLDGVLPDDVRVSSVVVAPDGFDARFSALARRYSYRVTDGFADPLRRLDTVTCNRPLNLELMNDASSRLLGEHDFAAYCKQRAGSSTVRRLLRLEWERNGDVAVATVEADAFCRSMVRSMVGALLAVGDGRRRVEWPAEILAAEVRDPAVTVAPAHGLTLEEVRYPPDDELEARAQEARAYRG